MMGAHVTRAFRNCAPSIHPHPVGCISQQWVSRGSQSLPHEKRQLTGLHRSNDFREARSRGSVLEGKTNRVRDVRGSFTSDAVTPSSRNKDAVASLTGCLPNPLRWCRRRCRRNRNQSREGLHWLTSFVVVVDRLRRT